MSSSGLCTYKDEVTELKDELNKAENQCNPVKYKQLIQQVILYMTKGIDMTALFMTIVKAAATKDLVQKKLCYLYLCHYASSHADLALLTVNTLKRDAEDTDYMVRGLALRSMVSLRLASLVEYTKDAMLKGVVDHSSYVRRAAVMGCLQLYKLAPQQINVEDLVRQMNERLTKDKDIQVRRNCMYALEEMLIQEKDSLQLQKFLLKKLQKFDEWGLQFALDILIRCRPENLEDIYSSLNCLDVCLKHANTSVVLGAVRVFLYYTSGLTELRDDVFNRIKVPLLTALSSKSPEIAYSVVCHIEIILQQATTLFEDSISSFYCRYNDPVYLKIKKLGVLSKLVTESNGKQILDELSFHARQSQTAFDSIHNIGIMALLHPTHADICIEKLFSFLQSRDDLVVSHALTALRDLVIKYDKYSALIPSVSKYLKFDLLPDGKASVLWILGEFGESIPEAPYVLETLIDDVDKETSPIVKVELLTASMKLFFKRPPECQAMLGHLLEYCIEQENNMDIRYRALLYYRLLEIDVNKAKEVICCPRSAQFIDSSNIVKIDSKESLIDEFNTLSVVYGQPLSVFTRQESFQVKTVVREHKRKDNAEKLSMNEARKLGSDQSRDTNAPVNTNLVQIDNKPSQPMHKSNDSPKESLAALDQRTSNTEENISAVKDNSNQRVVSKNEPLLEIDEVLDPEDSNIDLQETTELSRNDHLDLDSDSINSSNDNLVPVNESLVLFQEDRPSLDGNTGEIEEHLGLEGSQSSADDGVSSTWTLVEEPELLSPEVFETLWRQLPVAESYEIQLDELPDQQEFLKLLADRRIYTMASTPAGAEQMRCFLYAQSDCYILCEVNLDRTTLELKCTIKMEDSTSVHSFIEVFQNCLVDVTTS